LSNEQANERSNASRIGGLAEFSVFYGWWGKLGLRGGNGKRLLNCSLRG